MDREKPKEIRHPLKRELLSRDAVEGLEELTNETNANEGMCGVVLKLLHIEVRDDVGIEEGRNDVHLLNLKIVKTSEGEKDIESCVPNSGVRDEGVAKVLHVSAGDEALL